MHQNEYEKIKTRIWYQLKIKKYDPGFDNGATFSLYIHIPNNK